MRSPQEDDNDGAADLQAAVLITESIGNCPKYLNKKAVTRRSPRGARLVGEGLPLTDEALALVARADMFFLSTTTGDTMDTNHRGGVPGFVRVVRNDADGVTLAYPECEFPLAPLVLPRDEALGSSRR